MSQDKNAKKNPNQSNALSDGNEPANQVVPLVDDSEDEGAGKKTSFVAKTVAILGGIFSLAKIRTISGNCASLIKSLFVKIRSAFSSLGSRLCGLIPKRKQNSENSELNELTANRTEGKENAAAKKPVASSEEFEEFSRPGWSIRTQAIVGLSVVIIGLGGYYGYGFIKPFLSNSGNTDIALNGVGEEDEAGGAGKEGNVDPANTNTPENDIPPIPSSPVFVDQPPYAANSTDNETVIPEMQEFQIPEMAFDPPAAIPDPPPVVQPPSNPYAASAQNPPMASTNNNTGARQGNSASGNTRTAVNNSNNGAASGGAVQADKVDPKSDLVPIRKKGDKQVAQSNISTRINEQGGLPVFEVPNSNQGNPGMREVVAGNANRSTSREIDWGDGLTPDIPDVDPSYVVLAPKPDMAIPMDSESGIVIPEGDNPNQPVDFRTMTPPPAVPAVIEPKYGTASDSIPPAPRFAASDRVSHTKSNVPRVNSSAVFNEITGPDVYQVQAGENYWTISEKHYKTGLYYKALAELNRSIVQYPNQLKAGTKIRIPGINVLQTNYPELCPELTAEGTPNLRRGAKVFDGENERTTIINRLSERVAASEREKPTISPGAVYSVQEGDTIFRIAKAELDSLDRWVEIYRLNSTNINNENFELHPGMRLQLPAIR